MVIRTLEFHVHREANPFSRTARVGHWELLHRPNGQKRHTNAVTQSRSYLNRCDPFFSCT